MRVVLNIGLILLALDLVACASGGLRSPSGELAANTPEPVFASEESCSAQGLDNDPAMKKIAQKRIADATKDWILNNFKYNQEKFSDPQQLFSTAQIKSGLDKVFPKGVRLKLETFQATVKFDTQESQPGSHEPAKWRVFVAAEVATEQGGKVFLLTKPLGSTAWDRGYVATLEGLNQVGEMWIKRGAPPVAGGNTDWHKGCWATVKNFGAYTLAYVTDPSDEKKSYFTSVLFARNGSDYLMKAQAKLGIMSQ